MTASPGLGDIGKKKVTLGLERSDWVVKSAFCVCRSPHLVPSTQLSVTPVLMDLMPSWPLRAPSTHVGKHLCA